MSESKIAQTELHAYLDGELDALRRAELESYLSSHEDEAQRLAEYRRNDETLRACFAPVLDEPVPNRFVDFQRSRGTRLWRYAAVFGWLLIGGIAGWHLHGLKRSDPAADAPAWAKRAVVAHVVYSPEVRHPVEVGADQEAHLSAWLSKRLGMQLKIPHLEALGYALVGGRLLPGDQGPVAQFMYQDPQGQRLTLYVRVNREQYKETAFRFAQDGSVRVFYWVDRGLGYALSGEVGKDDLLRIATAVYQHLNP